MELQQCLNSYYEVRRELSSLYTVYDISSSTQED